MSDIVLKLRKLEQLNNLVLFKWTSSTKRIGGKFIPLSEIRLNLLSCNEGVVHFSMAAPVLFMAHGRPQIRFFDSDLFRVVDGDRKNINLLHSLLHQGESAVEVKNCFHQNCYDDACKMVASKVLSIGGSLSYPVMRLALPDMFRITNRPETLRPIYSKAMLAIIGASPSDTADTLRDKFIAHIDWFGYKTDDGYVVNNECIAAGGMVCVTSEGISRTSGGPVFQAPMSVLKEQFEDMGWGIHLSEVKDDNMEKQAAGAV